MASSWEDARKCPKCASNGEEVGERPGSQPRSKIIILQCPKPQCPWYGTRFEVLINPDGTIPDALTHRPKAYNRVQDDGGATQRILERQLHQMQQPGGGEVTR